MISEPVCFDANSRIVLKNDEFDVGFQSVLEDVVEARMLGRFLPQIVVAGRFEIGAIRHREDVQQRLAVGVDAIGRDDVAGEAAGAAREDVARGGALWILDENQAALLIARLREVAAALEFGREPVAADRSRRPWPRGASIE